MDRPTPHSARPRTLLLVVLALGLGACDWPWPLDKQPADQALRDAARDMAPDQKPDKGPPPDTLLTPDGSAGPCNPACTANRVCDDKCWCWENPLSGQRHLNALAGEGKHHLITVGHKGTVLRKDHLGWHVNQVGSRDLNAVWSMGPSLAVAVGDGGTVYRWDGKAWTPVTHKAIGTEDLTGVWGSGVSDLHVVGKAGRALHHDGSSWKVMIDGTSSSVDFSAVWGVEAKTSGAFAVGRGCWVSRHNGTVWQRVAKSKLPAACTDDLNGVWVSSKGEAWAVGSKGTVLHTSQGAWALVTPRFTTERLTHVWGKGDAGVWATSDKGKVFWTDGKQSKMVYDGASDTKEDLRLNGVWGESKDEIYAVGNLGRIVHHDGSTWRSVLPGITDGLCGVWVTDKGDVLAVGHGGRLLVKSKGVWREEPAAPFAQTLPTACQGLQKVWARNTTDVYAVGYKHIFRYNGASWVDLAQAWKVNDKADAYLNDKADHVNWWSVWGRGASDLYVAGGAHNHWKKQGALVHCAGSSCTLHTAPPKASKWPNLSTVWGIGASDVYAVGLEGLFLMQTSAGWQLVDKSSKYGSWNMHGVWGTSPTNLYVSAKLGFEKTDAWYRGSVLRYDGKAIAKPYEVNKLHLGAIGGTGPSDIYVVGEEQTIHHFDGAAWSQVRAGSVSGDRGELHSVGAGAAGEVYVVGKLGTILRNCAR